MINHKIEKLEKISRLKELDPFNTLVNVGFKEGMTLGDIGAGTGIFSFEAAKISNATIYALDISDNMISLLEDRRRDRSVSNLEVLKVNGGDLPLSNSSCDMAILVTVLHEIDDKDTLVKEIKRSLRGDKLVLVVEFYKEETKDGPPINHRISEEEIESVFSSNGFSRKDKKSLGDNFYYLLYKLED